MRLPVPLDHMSGIIDNPGTARPGYATTSEGGSE
jgi:hypothetical protein